MKKLLFLTIFAGLICFANYGQHVNIIDTVDTVFIETPVIQQETASLIKNEVENGIISGFTAFFNSINWLFIVVFILISWLINDTIDSHNKATKWANFIAPIPKLARVLIIGICMILLFAWAFDFSNKKEVVALIFSLLLSLVIYKMGIDKIFAYISKIIGLK